MCRLTSSLLLTRAKGLRSSGLAVFIGFAITFGAQAETGTAITAQQIVERIQKEVGVPWRAQTVDTFKAGDPNTPVKGIATTAMATMDVLKQASKAGTNLVITYEPTFFGRQDGAAPPAAPGRGLGGLAPDDPVYKAKKEFIEKNGLVVFRLAGPQRERHDDRPGGATGLEQISGQAG
jgi:hypothetical protein